MSVTIFAVVEFEVLLDELVKPYNEITDYHTKYSGITAKLLDPVDTRLEQIQAAILMLIDAGTIVVGHSLENDLLALRVAHPNCLDTAIIYSSQRGPPYKPALRYLTKEYLNREIQDSDSGHSSVQVCGRLWWGGTEAVWLLFAN